jgi:hypothetical protein
MPASFADVLSPEPSIYWRHDFCRTRLSFYVRINATVAPPKGLLCREYWNAIWLDLDDLHPPSCQRSDVSRRRRDHGLLALLNHKPESVGRI